MNRPSTLLVGLAVPIGLTLVGVAVTAALAAVAPAEIAVHWGIDGRADGFAAPGAIVAAVAIGGVGLSALFGAILVVTLRDPWAPSPWHKLAGAVAIGATALIVALGIWTIASQVRSDAEPSSAVGLTVGAAAAVLIGAASWAIMPRAVRTPAGDPAPTAPLELGEGERAVWVGVARVANATVAVFTVALLVVLGVTVAVLVTVGASAWPLVLAPVVVTVLMAAFSRFTVRIDGSGIVVRAALGIPSWTIRPAEVESVAATRVEAMTDFGGWGVRFGARRRTGVVTRSGDALEIRRRSGRALVVTVDDAGTAAALLGAYAARAGSARA